MAEIVYFICQNLTIMKNNSIMILDDDRDDREIFWEAIEKINPHLKCIDFNSQNLLWDI